MTAATGAPAEALPPPRVLMVDDHPDNLLALQAVLEPLHIEAVLASSGEEALRRLLGEDFAVIILDVQMPGLDGFETARLIKRREKTRHVPIIFLTAISGAVEHHLKGYASGGVDYVYKPFEPEILRAKVQALLELVQLRQRLEREIGERIESERQLSQRERQLAQAESLAQVGAWTWDLATGVVTWSDELYRIFGVEPNGAPMAYDRYLARIHPDDRAMVEQAVARCRVTGEAYQVEHRAVRPDGTVVWLRGQGQLISADGVALQIVGVAQDVTAHRRAEEEFTQFFNLSLDLMAVADYRGFLTRVNPSFTRVLGWSERELLARPFLELVHPEDRSQVAQFLTTIQGGREAADYEVRMLRADGECRWIRASAKPVPEEGLVYAVGMDITERKRTAALLAESEERYRSLVEHAPEAIVVLDVGTGRFVEANREAERLFGMPRDELAGLGPEAVSAALQPDGGVASQMAALWMQRAAAGESGHFEWMARGASGQEVLCEIRLQALPGTERTLVRGSVTDITERRKAEKALSDLVEQERALRQSQEIAKALQASLLPESLPHFPGVTFAVRYVPGSDGLEVGGDFYDAFALQRGSAQGGIALLIGDIVGRGLRAAATMGQLRTALRAYALEEGAPTRVLERMEHLPKTLPEAEMGTLVYAVLQPDAGVLSYVSAGHPPPLLVRSNGTSAYLDGGRTAPLGVPALPSLEGLVAVEPGSMLILYTDGLVERPGMGLDVGLANLQAAANAGAHLEPEAMCDAIMAAMIGDAPPRDDVALLAVGISPIRPEHFRFSGTVDPHHLAPLRRALNAWMRAAQASGEEAADLVLATSEAVTNSMVHAYGLEDGTIEVDGRSDGEEITISVRDSGRWRSGSSNEGGRGLWLMRALARSVDVAADAMGTVVNLRRRLGEVLPEPPPMAERLPPAASAGEDDLIAVAHLMDAIDQSNVNETALSLARAVSNQQIGLLVDLTGLNYIDSSGIRLLFELKRRLERRRQKLWVYVPPSSPVYRVLQLAPFDAVVPAPSLEEALAELREAAGRVHTGGWLPVESGSPPGG